MFNNRHSDNVSIWSHITTNLLQSWMEDASINVLIIDSRSKCEYNQCHIQNSINISFSKIIKRYLLEDKLLVTELLINNSNELMDHNYNIVVYDQNSEHTNQLCDDSFTIILLDKLAQKFKSVSFLIGGFRQFQIDCSNLCETFTPVGKLSSFSTSNLNMRVGTAPIMASTISFTPNVNSKSATPFLYATGESHSASSTPQQTHPSSTTTSNNATVRQPTQILPFLYLGSMEDAFSQETLKALNITHVLNVSQQCPKPDYISELDFLRISINDSHCAKLLPFFETAFKFIENCRKTNQNILIHCLAGISRSPTLAIAYVMKHLNMRVDDAYKFVKDRRSAISPNLNFVGQLYEYEKQLQQKPPSLAISENLHQPADYIKINSVKLGRKPFVFDQNYSTPQQQLNSPSTALENFKLNSPCIDRSLNDLYSTFAATTSQQQQQQHKVLYRTRMQNNIENNSLNNSYLPKSSTFESLNKIDQSNNNVLSNLVLKFNPSVVNTTESAVEPQRLTRPSSIQLNRHLDSIQEQSPMTSVRDSTPINRQHQLLRPQISSTSSSSTSSSSATCSSCVLSNIESPVYSSYENSKKLKLSPTKDDSVCCTAMATCKSDINLSKFQFNDDFALSKPTEFVNKRKSLTLNLESPSGTTATTTLNRLLTKSSSKSQFENDCTAQQPPQQKPKSSAPSSSNSSNNNSLHGSIEKMIEVS